MSRPFTGFHMLAILVIGFGIVVAVNFTMAGFAIKSFGGLVVENSYVASQHFNRWLDESRDEQALGWGAKVSRDEAGHIVIVTHGPPQDARVSAQLRHPLGLEQDTDLVFDRTGPDRYRSRSEIKPGRWTVRLTIAARGRSWRSESEIS